jgi:type I restriction enzyme S subunit
MSEWQRVRLGEVMTLDVDAVEVDPQATYPIVGVLNRGRGLLFRDPISGSGTKYKTLNRIGPGQVVYSRLKAFEGAITVGPESLGEVYASQEFPTFTCGPGLLPAYFALVTTTSGLWDNLQNLSTGMGGRRERVKPTDFLTITLALPPVAEQGRIVDAMAAVDAQIHALEAESISLTVLRATTLDLLQTIADQAPQTTLGALVESSGGSIKTGPFGTALKAGPRQSHLMSRMCSARVGSRLAQRSPAAMFVCP